MTTARVHPVEAKIVATSLAAILVASFLGFLFGFINPLIRADLGLSRTRIGLLIGVFFGATGAGSIWAGRLADRLGARSAVALDMIIVIGVATSIAVVGSYAVLLVGSVVAGFGYALTNAGTNIAVAAIVAPRHLAFALSIKTAGVPIQVAVGSAFAPALGERLGWRPVVLSIALLALAVLVLVLRVLPGPVAPPRHLRAGERALPSRFWLFPVASFLLLVGGQPLQSWLVPFLTEALGLSLTRAGFVASAGATVGVIGMLVVARRADKYGLRSRFIAALSLFAALGTVAIWSGVHLGAPVVLVAAMAVNSLQLGAVGTLHAAIVDSAPHAIGRATGVTMTGYYTGALVAPLLFGSVVDLTGSFAAAWGICALALGSAAVAFLGASGIRHD